MVSIAWQAALIAAATVAAGVSATEKPATTRSFIIGPMYTPSVEVDEASCPAQPKSALALFRESLSPQQRATISATDNGRGLSTLMFKQLGFKRGPDDDTLTMENIVARRREANFPPGKGAISSYPRRHLAYDHCTNPEDFPSLATGHQEYLGQFAHGMNLDGKVSKGDLTGLDGEKGVDNAWYKAMGCGNIARSLGDPKVGDNVIVSRQAPTLIEVTGIDDERNDSAVEVNVYAASRPLDLDAAGKSLAWASYSPAKSPRYIARTSGRIVDGVLTTEPFDVNLRMHESIIDSSRDLRGARIKANLRPEGMDGGFYGYQTLNSFRDAYAQTSTVGSDMLSCPAEMLALRKHADGVFDPKSRRYTAISTALRFKAVPAFVIHTKSANSGTASR